MSRYRYTIIAAVIMLAVVGLLVFRFQASNDCKDSGKHYVHTFSGWECI